MNKNNISQDEIRQKVDGFSINHGAKETDDTTYKTTDQGVHFQPDDNVNGKENKKR